MIENPDVARQVTELMLGINDRLEQSVIIVRGNCSPEEATTFGMAVGKSINLIFERILDPIYLKHPTLKPSDLD